MRILLKLLLTAFVVLILSNFLEGITIDNYITAIVVAFTVAVLNMFVRPILIIFTLPVTILTLGLFLFIINAFIIYLAGKLINGFIVNDFFTAIIFSVLLSFFRSLLFKVLKEEK